MLLRRKRCAAFDHDLFTISWPVEVAAVGCSKQNKKYYKENTAPLRNLRAALDSERTIDTHCTWCCPPSLRLSNRDTATETKYAPETPSCLPCAASPVPCSAAYARCRRQAHTPAALRLGPQAPEDLRAETASAGFPGRELAGLRRPRSLTTDVPDLHKHNSTAVSRDVA